MDYDSFSEIYDLTCPGIEGDVEYFIKKAKGTTGKVLEVGCGTGRVLLELLKSGITAEGIDSSAKMLTILSDKAKKLAVSPNVRLQSVTDLSAQSEFGLILLPYRTFMHLDDLNVQREALQKLSAALTKGGEIVIDLFNPDLKRIAHGSSYTLLSSTASTVVWLWEEFNIPKQLVRNIFRAESIDANGSVLHTTLKEFQARWFYPSEFEILVHDAGLQVKEIFADYQGSPFTGIEDKMIWVLQKT